MVEFYVMRVENGVQTVYGTAEPFTKPVPKLWRAKVKAAFDEKLANEEITQEQYDAYMGDVE